MRKQMISFTDPQHDFLKGKASRLGISVADLVRRIIDNYRHGEAELAAIINPELNAGPPQNFTRKGGRT